MIVSTLVVLFFIALIWQRLRYVRQLRIFADELARLKLEVESRTPPESCLRDVATVWLQSEKAVMVQSYTISGAQDLRRWLRYQVAEASLRSRNEMLQRGQDNARHASNATTT